MQFYVERDTIEDYTDVRAAIPIDGDILWPECSDLLSLEDLRRNLKLHALVLITDHTRHKYE